MFCCVNFQESIISCGHNKIAGVAGDLNMISDSHSASLRYILPMDHYVHSSFNVIFHFPYSARFCP